MSSTRGPIAIVVGDAGIPILGDKGASVHVRALSAALIRQGQAVEIVAARRGAEGPNRCAAPIHEVRLSSDASCVVAAAREVARTPDVEEIARLLASRAIEEEILALNEHMSLGVVYERLSLWSYGGIAAARRLGVPFVIEANARLVTEQQRYRTLALPSLASGVERHVLRSADAVLAVSEPLARELVEAGAPPERTHVVPNGVDVGLFRSGLDGAAFRDLWQISGDDVVVGFVGSLKPWHGVDDLIRAVASVDDPSVRLVVVGDGPVRAACEAVAAQVRCPAIFTGSLPHEQIPGVVAAFDVAVAPYSAMADAYFSPLKLFEYAAMAKAIVAASGGQAEQLFPTDALLLYPAGDVAALAARIRTLAADPLLRNRTGRAAAAFVRANHSWDGTAARILGLIDAIAGRERGPWAA